MNMETPSKIKQTRENMEMQKHLKETGKLASKTDRDKFETKIFAGFTKYEGLQNSAYEVAVEILADVDALKESGAWKLEHSNWKAYCIERLKRSDMHFIQMRQFVEGMKALSQKAKKFLLQSGDIESKSIIATVSAIPKNDQAKVLGEVSENNEGKITVKAIKEVLENRKEEEPETPKKKSELVVPEVVSLDRFKVEIPKSIQAAWNEAEETGKLHMKMISEIRSDWKKEEAMFVECKGAIDELDTAYSFAKLIQPFAVCPKCAGKKCAVCSKRGYVSKALYEMSGDKK
jgi:hypothetical protein